MRQIERILLSMGDDEFWEFINWAKDAKHITFEVAIKAWEVRKIAGLLKDGRPAEQYLKKFVSVN